MENKNGDISDGGMKSRKIQDVEKMGLAKETSQATDRKIAKPYEPTPDERAVRETVRARRARRLHVKVSVKKGAVHLSLDDHPQKPNEEFLLLMEALGTSDPDICGEILLQLGKVATQGENVSERALKFLLSVIKGVGSKDPLEILLTAQMSAVHMLTHGVRPPSQ